MKGKGTVTEDGAGFAQDEVLGGVYSHARAEFVVGSYGCEVDVVDDLSPDHLYI